MPRRVALLVSAVALVDTMFFAAIAPLVPFYTDELGLSKSAAGILVGAYPAGSVLGSLPAGWLAARAGTKPTTLLGLAIMAATSVVFGFAHHIAVLDVSRFVQGLGGACMWSGGLGWLVGVTPRARRGEAIGVVVGTAVFGALLGPVLGGIATALGTGPVFTGVGVVAVVLFVLALGTHEVAEAVPVTIAAAKRVARDPRVIGGFWLVLLPALTFGVLEVLGPLRIDDLGGGAGVVAAAFLLSAGAEAALAPIAGRLSDRRGRRLPLQLGLAGTVVFGIVLPLPEEAWLVVVAIVLAGPVFGLMYTPAMALLSDGAEAAGLDQGAAAAVISLAWAIGQVIGSAAGARTAEAAGDAVPYGLVSALALFTLAVWRFRAP
ncbi:MAG TPA: MFS transporter, partial [Gemmatimonadaceae bacterium]|nr:MFS transporter [Gemmatimonadaceae bacterium]